MALRSFRSRMIFSYTLVLSAVLTVFGFIVFEHFKMRLNRNVEELLLARADGVFDSFVYFWEKERSDPAGPRAGLEALNRLEPDQFAAVAQSWAARKSKDPLLFGIVVSIFDRTGREVASSKTMGAEAAMPPGTLDALLLGSNRLYDIETEMVPGRPAPFRALFFPAIINEKVNCLIRIMTPLGPIYSTLRSLRFILFVFLPVGILLSGAAAGFLTGLTLRPVGRITDTARLIGVEDLKTRITLPEGRDEIRRLAETFNDMLDRLEKSFTSQREFIENLSHEIKTPLAILKGELEVTLKRIRSSREYEDVLGSSLEETDRIIRIVDDLLMLARYDSNTMVLENASFELPGLVREAAAELDVLAEQKKIDIRFVESGRPAVQGDRPKLKRVFLDLLDNAVKFTPEGGRIEAEVGLNDGWASVRITDSGIGMPEELTARIFDRFYRAGRSGDIPGSGLGLAIVKSIVEAHKGRIEVRSAPGEGSVFTVFLPAVGPRE